MKRLTMASPDGVATTPSVVVFFPRDVAVQKDMIGCPSCRNAILQGEY